ncbi:Nitrate/nitrite transporter NarK [Thermostaphylospora chromogena]|uniref:Nitrate/nitrite transporter NarK n=2 Tax=Thermostaphylospora chromogena TaxID=35622 RepID=A0A1H1I0D6_9ACTN|nr:Nitrate/nitrite transporter NarK [Thermostaphylospora chromogena]
MTRCRVWAVWAVGMSAYLVGVMHRTSFGVAGLDAVERFHATSAALSGFVVLQILVYAFLQVPVGMMLDRFGARRMIVAGALIMAAGQLLLALSTSLPLAVAARVLVGAGDAFTFISVLTVVSAWFPPRRVPLMTQLTGLLGQFGQVLSAIPLAALLHGPGWTPAFVSAAALGVAVAIAVIAVVRDRPAGAPAVAAAESPREVLDGLRRSWLEPGTRLALWTHMGTQFSATVFMLLWGVPYLVAGHGMSTGAASSLLTIFVIAGAAAGPVMGELSGRRPERRVWLVISVIGLNALVWTAVLLTPAPAPYWLLVLLVVVLAFGGAASLVAFDFARTFNPRCRQGTAVGIANMGGFIAALLVALAIGVVLDAIGAGYSAASFHLAWAIQYAVWALTLAGIVLSWRKARRRSAEAAARPPLPAPTAVGHA